MWFSGFLFFYGEGKFIHPSSWFFFISFFNIILLFQFLIWITNEELVLSRIVPGQYLAIDPKGRAVMVGAIEKQKLVFIMNRDAQARLTISSPLEAHKTNTIVFHIVGVDVGFENPLFACLEIDYEEADNDPTGKTKGLIISPHPLHSYHI